MHALNIFKNPMKNVSVSISLNWYDFKISQPTEFYLRTKKKRKKQIQKTKRCSSITKLMIFLMQFQRFFF